MNALLQQFLTLVRRGPLVTACLVLILLLGAANYYLWQRHHTLTAGHEVVRRSGEDMLLSLTGHARVTAELATMKEALDFIDRNLINEGDLAENLGYFYQIETASRIRLSQINQLSSQPRPEGSPFKSVPFTLRATGTYRQIMRLLRELETGPRLLKIQTYSLTGSTGTDTDSITLDLTLEMLARP